MVPRQEDSAKPSLAQLLYLIKLTLIPTPPLILLRLVLPLHQHFGQTVIKLWTVSHIPREIGVDHNIHEFVELVFAFGVVQGRLDKQGLIRRGLIRCRQRFGNGRRLRLVVGVGE